MSVAYTARSAIARSALYAVGVRPLLAANVLIFLGCFAAGAGVFLGGTLAGIGDDWYTFNPSGWPSAWAYFADWYAHSEGRIGQAAVNALFRVVLFGRSTPEDSPWWFIFALSLGCQLALPLNLVAAARRVT